MSESKSWEHGDDEHVPNPQQYLRWIEAEHKSAETYHDHKEKMAWGATALYVSVIAGADHGRIYAQTWTGKLFLSMMVIAIGYLVFLYVQMQFQMRWSAADRVDAFRKLRADLLGGKRPLSQSDYQVVAADGQESKPAVWPRFIADAIKSCEVPRKGKFRAGVRTIMNPPQFIASVLPRLRTELVSYLSLVLITVIAIVIIWVPSQENKTPEALGGKGPLNVNEPRPFPNQCCMCCKSEEQPSNEPPGGVGVIPPRPQLTNTVGIVDVASDIKIDGRTSIFSFDYLLSFEGLDKVVGAVERALRGKDERGDANQAVRFTFGHFISGQAEIESIGSANAVKAVFSRIGKQFPSAYIGVYGHTDNIPIRGRLSKKFPSNWELSTARATNAARFLIDAAHVNTDHLFVTGYADTQPIASNDRNIDRQLNRRVEIVVYPEQLAKTFIPQVKDK